MSEENTAIRRNHVIKGVVLVKLNKDASFYKRRKENKGIRSEYMFAGNKGRSFYATEDEGLDSLKTTVPHSDIESVGAIIDGRFKMMDVEDFCSLYSSVNI